MARERWFYAKDMRRIGPLPKRRLVESLLGLPDPRGSLIWRHGLPAWTPAREVPEIDGQLAPFVKAPFRDPEPTASVTRGTLRADAASAANDRSQARPETRSAAAVPNVALYFGGLGVLLLVVVVGWFVWPRANDHRDATSASSAGRGPGAEGFAGLSDREVEMPPAELGHLRGVGAWSGTKLAITLYNGSTWRITEILVRTSRLHGEEFVDAETPHWLQPVGGPPLDAGTAALLKKVAPDRRKPGVNPLDTGPFEATIGPQPEAYRWRIEGARGYPPLR
jgi:GYF domain 2